MNSAHEHAVALDTAVREVVDLLADDGSCPPDQANDLLHGALAVTAGAGALCTMPAAVQEIHRAENQLAEGQSAQARSTLVAALRLIPTASLPAPPAMPTTGVGGKATPGARSV